MSLIKIKIDQTDSYAGSRLMRKVEQIGEKNSIIHRTVFLFSKRALEEFVYRDATSTNRNRNAILAVVYSHPCRNNIYVGFQGLPL